MIRAAIVVTGLPASGKSTLARRVADATGLPLLDKDDFLEALYDVNPVPDIAARRRLSRESDVHFIDAATDRASAVLVSHWRTVTSGPASGTPTEWLSETFDTVMELYCECTVDEAVRRFKTRDRHPGHRDRDRVEQDLTTWFKIYASGLPIGLGEVTTVNALDDDANQDMIASVARALAPPR